MNNIVVLISGRGSNLRAIYNSNLQDKIDCVISNKSDALGIDFAKHNGIPFKIIDHSKFNNREEFDKELAKEIDLYNPKIIVLAGFMRILTPWFINRYLNKIINIHPSILPSFVGAKAQSQAIKACVKVSGVSVHFVTDKLDHGPIIAQAIVPISHLDNETTLSNRTLEIEHIIYPFVINKILENKFLIREDGYVEVLKEESDLVKLEKHTNSIFY